MPSKQSKYSNLPSLTSFLLCFQLGSTAIGVCTSEGVVLGVEKRVTSILLESSSIEKIVEIDTHIGCAMSGLTADARTMIDHARVESQNHRFTYDEPLRVESCTQAVCDLALRFGEGDDDENERVMSRPFGVALLVAGVDEDGPQLYHAEPSGTFYRYDAKAIGSGSEGAQAELQNEYFKVCWFFVLWLTVVYDLGGCRGFDFENSQAGYGGKVGFKECSIG
jgi:20S proteasome subunit alpha 5